MKKLVFLVVMVFPLMLFPGSSQQVGTSNEVLQISANLPFSGKMAYSGPGANDRIKLTPEEFKKKMKISGEELQSILSKSDHFGTVTGFARFNENRDGIAKKSGKTVIQNDEQKLK